MKLLAVFILLGLSPLPASDLPLNIEYDSKRIAEILGKEWTVEGRDTEIIITSTFDVYQVVIAGRVTVLPEFSLTADPDAAASHAARERYVIRLEYDASLGDEELQKRLSERRRFVDLLKGRLSRQARLEALEALRTLRIPRYYSGLNAVCRVLPDRPGGQIYPASAVSKIGGAKELLDAVLGPHRNADE